MRSLPPLLVSLSLALLSSCTILRVDSGTDPPRVQASGVLEGHVALGIRDETHLLHASILDGGSPGSIAEIVIWKLFRLEIGVLGVSVGIGPLDVGLGALMYDPRLPRFLHTEEEDCERLIVSEEEGEEPHSHGE
jgi:hypothetical protein